MTLRVFVKVVGFSAVERHALNTVFRLSEQRATIYSHWQAGAGTPQLALVDGQSPEARAEMESKPADLKAVWVGAAPPANAWRTFQRPIAWPAVVSAMDQLFAPTEVMDFDLDFDNGPDTQPPDPAPPGRAKVKRALIAAASRDDRLYLRARLALAELTQADDAESGAQALELARLNPYAVALVDFGLPDMDGWAFLKELAQAQPSLSHVIITKAQVTVAERLHARMAGAQGLFQKPPHPEKLHDLLRKV